MKRLASIILLLFAVCTCHAQGGEQKALFSKTFDYPAKDKANTMILAPSKGKNMVIDYISIYTNYTSMPVLVYRDHFELPLQNLFKSTGGKDRNYSERVQYVILDGEQMKIKVSPATNEGEVVKIYVAGHELPK